MTQQSALNAFEAVCENEQFASLRDMLPVLGLAARALVSSVELARDLQADVDTRYRDLKLLRALYLVRLLRGRMSTNVRPLWDVWLARFDGVVADRPGQHAFFHRDDALADRPCHDDFARALGLSRGVDTGKLLQLLKVGHA